MVKDYRIFPSQEQKEIINSALGTYRYIYNRCIDFLKDNDDLRIDDGEVAYRFYLDMKLNSIEEQFETLETSNITEPTTKFKWLWDTWDDWFIKIACEWAYYTVKGISPDKYAYITKKDTANCGKICIPVSTPTCKSIDESINRELETNHTKHMVHIPTLGMVNIEVLGQIMSNPNTNYGSPLEIERRIGREFSEEYYLRIYFPNPEDTSK